MSYVIWDRDEALLSGWEYKGNNNLALELAKKGFESIIKHYTYVGAPEVQFSFELTPFALEAFRGVGIDLGGGAGVISSAIARAPLVEKIYCVEFCENCVKLCQPMVKERILELNCEKVVSVLGDFNRLNIEDESLDFVVAWDSMHHSNDVLKTLSEAWRVLKPDCFFVLADRAHNNATPETEIERMLNFQYSEQFLIENCFPRDVAITRRQNGEHEYRYNEWESFFTHTGFRIVERCLLKTRNDRNVTSKNDAGVPEVFVDFQLGGYLQQKLIYVLQKQSQNPSFCDGTKL